MDETQWLAEQFEANRSHLQAVAYRMLGSLTEADDAVQESWLRFSRTDSHKIDNLRAWLTTVVARICLDMLRSRRSRREQPLDVPGSRPILSGGSELDPDQEALLADSVGLALLVVLDTLTPAERLAFVLHDIFAVPFDEIAPIVERSEAATRQLASRARRRVQGSGKEKEATLTYQRELVDAFLAASREGSFEALLALLDPDVAFRADHTIMTAGTPREVRGATSVARHFTGRAQGARPALINGSVGAVVTQQGRLFLVLNFTVVNGKIVDIEAIGDPARLSRLRVSVLGG